ncbi:splicing factor [Plasmopara halstedii]|uniref:Splicing factor n=1 Tax=Plasmopara halstedii TaxID=4781 RepID=A0A0P1A6L6_PLAHL|nr:splicing factor [Plasmopara halstedii]CEG36253.1 splicing factor [Plasmopara halstedii]|eukprot:XP_024572622.1 splicing factor [Plasmopara halstedii]
MARVYVGNLPEIVRERDLSDMFERFGRLLSVQIKFPTRPPPFAFLTYEDERDASDAVRSMNNVVISGSRIRVEMSRGTYEPRRRGTQYRVTISGLPDTMSWQDLKDFLRKGGDVIHTDVDRRGHGSASFATSDEMHRAIRKLNDFELNGDRIRIREDVPRNRSRSLSRSPRRRHHSRSRSISLSPRRNRIHRRRLSPSRSR